MTTITLLSSLLVWFCLMSGGCSKPPAPKVPVVNPQALGSSSELGDLKSFLAGRWGVEIYLDPSRYGQLPGMDAVVKDLRQSTKDQKIEDVFSFKEDGRFKMSGGTWGHKVEGAWKEQGVSIVLSYDKLDGKPFQERMSEIAKASESGTQGALYSAEAADRLSAKLRALGQLRLNEHKTFLIFQETGTIGGVEDNGFRLVRLEKTPK